MLLTRGVVAAAVADDQRRELVASQAGGGVPGAHGCGQAPGGLDEEFVARLVADGVVDLLEAVEVDEEDGRAAVGGAAASQREADPLGEQGAVGQVGERVVFGVVLQLCLQAHPFGDVPAVEDEAAVVAVDRRLHVQPGAGAGAEAALDAGRRFLDLARREEAAHFVDHAPEVLGMDDRGELRPDELLGVTPVDPGGGRADVPEDAVRSSDHDDVAGALDQGAEVVLLLRQLLGEGDVVEEHDALAHDEGQDDRAGREEDHAVDALTVQDVVQNSQRTDGGGQIGRERRERSGDGAGDLVPRERGASVVLPAPRPHPGRVREQQRPGEPAGVEDLSQW